MANFQLTVKHLVSRKQQKIWGQKPHVLYSTISLLTYLTLRLAGRSFSTSDLVLHLQIVDEGVSLLWGEVRLSLLSKVELNRTILNQDVREQGTACQGFFGCPESHTQMHSILREAHLHLVTTVKVLKVTKQRQRLNLQNMQNASIMIITTIITE